jgi:hypothetical protein
VIAFTLDCLLAATELDSLINLCISPVAALLVRPR